MDKKVIQRSQVGPQSGQPPSRVLVVLAFAAIYLIWGSTYLGIRYAIETLPPFLMAASRFLIAGVILFTWAILRDRDQLTAVRSLAQWRRAFVVGGLLLLGGNGGVTWAEQYLASGLAALLVATEPAWVVILNWSLDRKRPNAKVLLGLLLGLVGVALLFKGSFSGGLAGPGMTIIGAIVVFAASAAWAGGSVYSNRRPIKAATSMSSGMQMIAGGGLLLLVSLCFGEFRHWHLQQASWLSIGAFCYLTVFGSVVAFTAYSWLLRNVSPTRTVTYAYVNPVVAVLLGWLLAGEPFTSSMLFAASVIVASVVLITTYGKDTPARDRTIPHRQGS